MATYDQAQVDARMSQAGIQNGAVATVTDAYSNVDFELGSTAFSVGTDFTASGSLDYITCNFTGTVNVSMDASFYGPADIYEIALFEDTTLIDLICKRKIGNAGDVGSVAGSLLSVAVTTGDKLYLKIKNADATADAVVFDAISFKVERVT